MQNVQNSIKKYKKHPVYKISQTWHATVNASIGMGNINCISQQKYSF